MGVFGRVRAVLLVAAVAGLPALAGAQTVEDRTQDKVAFPAHKIMGNLYYVGTGTLNSYLITTPQGHILINTNFEDTIPLLKASIEKLGFKMTDIKIILGSHAHGDHPQADGTVKEMTGGATVVAMEQDVPALENIMANNKPHPIDRVIKDGDQVTLGGATNPYIDPAGYKAWVANTEKNYNALLAEQRKNPPTN